MRKLCGRNADAAKEWTAVVTCEDEAAVWQDMKGGGAMKALGRRDGRM
jgi:hypothetical protein